MLLFNTLCFALKKNQLGILPHLALNSMVEIFIEVMDSAGKEWGEKHNFKQNDRPATC